jgi:hypothetical protein
MNKKSSEFEILIPDLQTQIRNKILSQRCRLKSRVFLETASILRICVEHIYNTKQKIQNAPSNLPLGLSHPTTKKATKHKPTSIIQNTAHRPYQSASKLWKWSINPKTKQVTNFETR